MKGFSTSVKSPPWVPGSHAQLQPRGGKNTYPRHRHDMRLDVQQRSVPAGRWPLHRQTVKMHCSSDPVSSRARIDVHWVPGGEDDLSHANRRVFASYTVLLSHEHTWSASHRHSLQEQLQKFDILTVKFSTFAHQQRHTHTTKTTSKTFRLLNTSDDPSVERYCSRKI